MKKTLIIGASSNAERYAHRAAIQLMQHGHEIIQLGKKQGQVNGNIIYTSWPEMEHVDTITLYINPLLQKNYYELILLLNPKRIIFNPGAENPVFAETAREHGIETLEACTLVMLGTGQY